MSCCDLGWQMARSKVSLSRLAELKLIGLGTCHFIALVLDVSYVRCGN